MDPPRRSRRRQAFDGRVSTAQPLRDPCDGCRENRHVECSTRAALSQTALAGRGINRRRARAVSTRHATLMEHTRRFGVFTVRSLLSVWVSSSLATLGYAYADLSLTPGLHQERGFSIQIDISRIGELWHWGGRLLNEGAISLLVLNAIMVGGFLSLLMLWVGQLLRRVLQMRRAEARSETSASTSVAFGSVPPPAG
jgi:hypothetical protein